MNLIEIRNISKNFGSIAALTDINICLEPHKIYGLLGRNGAGKTTLINLMTNKLFPDHGEILINGENVTENDTALSSIYCVAEGNLFPDNMKIREAFKWTGAFYPDFDLEYANLLSKQFALDTRKKIKSLSTGYASIFKIILALASNAEILLLDEPVLGLDANHRDMFYKELLANYMIKPRTIIISTHLIEEAADLLEEVIIIKEGRLLINENAADLMARGFAVSGAAVSVDRFAADKDVLAVESMAGFKTAYILGDSGMQDLPADLALSKLDLQKLFIHLTNS
jgi:ABC-2 type transport system ATP-binding protein